MDFFIFTFFLLLLRNSQRFSNSSLLQIIKKNRENEAVHAQLRPRKRKKSSRQSKKRSSLSIAAFVVSC